MTSKKTLGKKFPKNFKLCFKFVFLTKKFKEGTNIKSLKLFLYAMIKHIIIHNILDIIKNWNLINVFIKKYYENIYLSVSYDFSKFNESKKIKV